MQSTGATAPLLPHHPGGVPWCPECPKPHVLLVVRRRAVGPWGHPMGQEEECVPAALSGYRCPGRGSADARVHSGVLLMDGSVRGVGRAGGAEAHP